MKVLFGDLQLQLELAQAVVPGIAQRQRPVRLVFRTDVECIGSRILGRIRTADLLLLLIGCLAFFVAVLLFDLLFGSQFFREFRRAEVFLSRDGEFGPTVRKFILCSCFV